MNFNRVVIVGDFLRPGKSVEHNVLWLNYLLCHPIRAGTGLPVSFARKTADDRITVERWAETYNSFPSSSLIEKLESDYKDCLLISFETSPILWRCYQAAKIPVIDCSIHPVRFMDDLMLGFRSNNLEINEAIGNFQVNLDLIEHQALMLKSRYTREPLPISELSGNVIFFPQVSQDRTMIDYGRFTTFDDIVGNLKAFIGDRQLFVRPHPYEAESEIVLRSIAELNGQLILEPTYYLLASDIKFDPIVINSSVGYEAAFFGRFATYLVPATTPGIPVLHEFLNPHFWAEICGGDIIRRVYNVPFIPNRLRKLLNVDWGFNA